MINRKSLVTRHNPKLKNVDVYSPLSIGNGDFVFTADITGLQSFNEAYDHAMPLCTMSNWGWHTTPISDELYKYDKSDIEPRYYDTNGRQVPYYTNRTDKDKYNAIRQNPHKANLGKVGFVFLDDKNEKIAADQMTNIDQELNIYTGILTSKYDVNNTPCSVTTACDATSDTIAVAAKSTLIKNNKMFIEVAFPYPSCDKNGSDWGSVDAHNSELLQLSSKSYKIIRTIDRENYNVFITSVDDIEIIETSKHTFKIVQKQPIDTLSIQFEFTQAQTCTAVNVEQVFINSEAHWKEHWENGGIIDFSKSSNKAAYELERRVVLSQYLTAIQCGGKLPPAETGLTCNSWYGKFHLEMHFWHAAHFALFNRIEMLEKSLDWYKEIMPEAKILAQSQGYEGARWPKMVGPDGVDSPSPIGPLLIWQQPHVILYCNWCYKSHPDQQTLLKYKDLIFETATFMASYAVYDETKDRYVLGPPVIPAQERHAAQSTMNPTFELEYWIYGLKQATAWFERLSLEVPAKWLDIIDKLSLPTINDGVYMAQENCLDTFERVNNDHPSMLGAYGMLDSDRIDKLVMSKTLDRVLNEWKFETLWGWDFSIMGMTAARLGRKQDAVDILLKETPKNVYPPNGHNRQVLREDLPLYLPGNGGLLLAVAMMLQFDAFPNDGSWDIEYEDMKWLM